LNYSKIQAAVCLATFDGSNCKMLEFKCAQTIQSVVVLDLGKPRCLVSQGFVFKMFKNLLNGHRPE
jgi:hypothetical protein